MNRWILSALSWVSYTAVASELTDNSGVNQTLVFLLVILTVFLICLVLYIVFIKRNEKDRQYESIKFSSQAVIVTENNGHITYANDAALTLVSSTMANITKQSIFTMIPSLPSCLLHNLSYKDTTLSKVCLCQKFAENNQEFLLKTDDHMSIPTTISVLRQKNGDFVYYLKELTAQKSLEKQLEMQNKVATFGEFLAGVLHEVGNPMAAIEGIAHELQWQLENNQQDFSFNYLKDQLNTIQEQAHRVNEVKNEFSMISSGSSTQVEVLSLIDMRNMLIQLVDLAKFDKRSRYIKINLHCPSGLPAILSHPGKLTQILLNIISNAIDALQEVKSAKVDISVVISDDKLHITLKDNGPGIEQEYIDKVFEAFYTTKEQGTGLGLLICKRLAKSLDIDFEITSEIATGTSVTLKIPLNDGNA